MTIILLIIGEELKRRVSARFFPQLGGTAPITWTVDSGLMPAGLFLNASGTISGPPTTSGTFNFAVEAQDSSASPLAGVQALSITVNN